MGSGVRERLATEGRVRVLVSRSATRGGAGRRASGTRGRPLPVGRPDPRGLADPRGARQARARRTTRAVVLDRVVRPAGQVGAAQIGADRLLRPASRAPDGRSASSTRESTSSTPTWAPRPPADGRIVGGWNFADGNADIYDCDGHGTAVAGVAAGAQGIAPEASIVALKVFGARDGCSGALRLRRPRGRRLGARASRGSSGSTS